MENLNAEQIKKALECCLTPSAGDCIACKYRRKKSKLFATCTNCLMADALALINSQEQRIKELTEERKDFEIRALRAENESAKYKDRWETSRKDFERLADEYENLHASCTELTRVQEENKRLTQELNDLSREYDLYKRFRHEPDFFKVKQQIEDDRLRNMHTVTLNRAIETYGKDMQLNVAIEELSELIKEICKYKRGSDNRKAIIEEMADCYIMLQQMRIIFGIATSDLRSVEQEKMIRLEKRLEERTCEG